MTQRKHLKKIVRGLRKFRVLHRYLGIVLAAFLLISAVTGILLSLKKEVAWIQPPSQKGIHQDLQKWKSLDEISQLATLALHQNYPDQKENTIKKMDVRPSKGIVKVIFEKDYWEVQMDGATGDVKSIATRQSDWLESIHDGSIVSDFFKLFSMNFLGFGVMLLVGSGLWLWYGPKLLRGLKRRFRSKIN